MSSLEEKIKIAAEESVIKMLESGNWIKLPSNDTIKINKEIFQDIWNMVDLNEIKKHIKERIEKEIADRIVNHIAGELSNDIKQLLSNQDQREKIRAIAKAEFKNIIKNKEK